MKKQPFIDKKFKIPLTGSALVHGLLILLLITGLPIFIPHKKPPLIMSVEIVTPEKKQEKQKTSRPIPTPPKSIKKPSSKPKPPEPVPAPPSAKPKPPPKPEKAPEKPKAKPTPPKKDDEEDFASLLKNLAPDAAPDKKSATGDKSVSNSEMAALTAQLKQCWNIVGGARYAETLSVEVKITVNRDRTIASAAIVDKLRYNNDNAFRAAADSAIRAVRNPRCTPLDLPPEKYDAWKTIFFNFDPSGVL